MNYDELEELSEEICDAVYFAGHKGSIDLEKLYHTILKILCDWSAVYSDKEEAELDDD